MTRSIALFFLLVACSGSGDKPAEPGDPAVLPGAGEATGTGTGAPTGTGTGAPTGTGTGASTGTGTGAPTGTGTGAPTGTGTGAPTGTGTGAPTGTGTGAPTGTGTGAPTGTGTGAPTGTGTGAPTGTGTGMPTGTGTGMPTGTGTGMPTGTGTGNQGVDGDLDGFYTGDDCDDDNALVFPGAPELCDGLDNDCDGVLDDGLTLNDYFVDGDADGYGDPGSVVQACTAPYGMISDGTDCDDEDYFVHPNAAEICNGDDDDCNGLVDDNAWPTTDWWPDLDQDGRGDTLAAPTASCLQPTDMVGNADDCDDTEPTVYVGASEVCDGLDNDCNGPIDDGAGQMYYPDVDFDSWGDASDQGLLSCTPVPGWVLDNTDCDDSSRNIFPGAPVANCDMVDSDCDGIVEDLTIPGTWATVNDAANQVVDGDWVCILPGVYPTNNAILDDAVTWVGIGGATQVVLDGGGTSTVLSVRDDVTLIGLTVQGGDATTGSGINHYNSDLVIEDSVIADNECTNGWCVGVGISSSGSTSTLTIRRSEIRDNYALVDAGLLSDGAGLATYETAVVLEDVLIQNNVYDGDFNYFSISRGAGAYFAQGTADLNRVQARDNKLLAMGSAVGGGLAFSYTDTTMRNVQVSGNVVDGPGSNDAGGISFFYSDSDLENVVVAGNVGSGFGSVHAAGVMSIQSAVDARQVAVVGNWVDTANATTAVGWYSSQSQNTLTNCVIQDNTAGYGVAGGYEHDSGTSTFRYTNVFGNSGSDYVGMSDPTGTSGNLSIDSLFVSTTSPDPAAWDLHLQLWSQLTDVGDPAIIDADLTPSDIGAHGGPLGESY